MFLFYGLFVLIATQIITNTCHPVKSIGKYCYLVEDGITLKCRKHLPNVPSANNVTILELHNLNWDVLDLNRVIEKFPNVKNISVYGWNISRIITPLKTNNNIEILQFKDLKLNNLSETFLDTLPNLQVLNLERSHLHSLPANFSTNNLKTLNLIDNKWDCSKNLDWVLKLNKSILENLKELSCHGEPYSGKSLIGIATFLDDIKKDCPLKCNCSLPEVVQNPESDLLEPIIEVNCSERHLNEMPTIFPLNTKILHLENNDIVDISPLRHNHKYLTVLDIYLDNNYVKSIEELEGSHWLTHFRVFSLSGNKLTELPSYALDNALQQNTNMPNAVQITLGKNPWRCDCAFTPVFQELLQKYAPQVKDIQDVKCSYVEGDENSLLPIIDLSRTSVCRLPTEYSIQEALDLLNAVLASLIVFVLGKLAYDYYHFKKTGKLPWIVMKMP